MAGVPELTQFDDEVFQLETDTLALGGPDGPANAPSKALANRTQWLRGLIEAVCTAQGVSLNNTEVTQFLTALDARYVADADIGGTSIIDTLALKAPLDSAALIGTPTSPTPPVGEVSDRIATMAALNAAVKGADITARFTTTGNITLSGLATQAGGDWGAALTTGDIILAKDQGDALGNGWYVADSGPWPRVAYLKESDEIKPSSVTRVSEGATLADTSWMLTTDAPIVIGAKPLSFADQNIGVAKTNVNNTFTRAQRGHTHALGIPSNPTIIMDMNMANNFSMLLEGNHTLGTPLNVVAGQSGYIWVQQDGVGNRTLSYPAGGPFVFADQQKPILSTTPYSLNLLFYAVLFQGWIFISHAKSVGP